MESPDSALTHTGGPYPEEILLEAFNLEWESIELRCQRLKKTWQQFLLMEKMEKEELQYKQQLRRLKRQEQQKQEREQEEALRRQQEEKEAQDREQERKAALYKEQEAKRQKKLKKVVNDTKMGEESVPNRKKVTKVKPTVVKAKKQTKKNQKSNAAVPKRITPINLPSVQPEDDSVSEENQDELGGYDSPPPELPDNGLLNVLSLDKGSDSDDDDEPSMVSLILPVAEDSPIRQPSPLKKKTLTPRKRFAKKKGPSLDFNFTNAEARRQAKAEADAAEQEESDGAASEPEPEPATATPQKRLKRRKDQKANRAATLGGKSLMATMANTAIPVKTKKGTGNSIPDKSTGSTVVGKKNPRTKAKTQTKNGKASAEAEENLAAAPTRKKVGSRSEPMSIKQRLANAELLARINKMQDISTPKVLGKKSKKTQEVDMLATKRLEIRKTDAAEPDVPQRDQMMEEGDLNISLNSSGLISDDESPGNLRAPTRKRPRGTADGDVTPAKKLQFLEITKRLAKSPMPRYLRTPTPLMSPVVEIKPKAASPGPRPTNHSTVPTRRLNSAPVRPKKTTSANRFGGGGSTASNGGGFSMFDAFVNSGSGGGIPRLKVKNPGDVSPSV
ncbi:hypothetical protein V7S43_001421 [Phytophthora oleae]|uniref:Inner centromere protein ARK-binding domain-containing protein n=1 Tax=Phytophthora oleae TaxID=2107226 RepID=A0ABD3G5I0_9STRA